MHLFTLIGTATILACGIEGARRLNGMAQKEVSLIDAYVTLVRYITVQIDCFARPIGDILKNCDKKILETCGIQNEASDLFELFSCCELSDKDALSIFGSFCSEFGKSYLDEQLKRCEICVSSLEKRKEELSSELQKKKKVNFTLCISGAICLIILLL